MFLDATCFKSSMAGNEGASTVLWADVDSSSSGVCGEINVGRSSCGRAVLALLHCGGFSVNFITGRKFSAVSDVDTVFIRQKEGKLLF
jgi:hypothetical protein